MTKIIAELLMPIPLVLFFLLSGLFLLSISRLQRLARVLLFAGTGILVLFSLQPFAERALMHLENTFPVLHAPPEAEWIVVLGGGTRNNENLPTVFRLSTSSQYRLSQGMRIANLLPKAKLIVSGGGAGREGMLATAELYAAAAIEFGIDPARIILLSNPKNTYAEAREVAGLIKEQEIVILVTSASHMRRAAALFQSQGLHIVPAPTGHLVNSHEEQEDIMNWVPQLKYLGFTQRVMRENIGLLWAHIKGIQE